MAFCGRCGSQLHENATFCANCGASTAAPAAATQAGGATSAPQPALAPPIYVPTAPLQPGFFSCLFDVSFTRLLKSRGVKAIFVIAIISAVLEAVALLIVGVNQTESGAQAACIIAAPIVFFLLILFVRVQMEVLHVVFGMAEHIAEIAERARR